MRTFKGPWDIIPSRRDAHDTASTKHSARGLTCGYSTSYQEPTLFPVPPVETEPNRTRPLVMGHRGASLVAHENTIAAFIAARDQGADGVELDVHATADGNLVVHHDAEAEGVGILAERTVAEITAALPFVPTLDAVLDVCTGLLVNIEIKNSPNDSGFDRDECVAAAVVELLHSRNMLDRVLVSSFHLPSIDRVRELDAGIDTGYLFVLDPTVLIAAGIAVERGHSAIHPFFGVLAGESAAELIDAAHAQGLQVNVWTVNDEAEMIRLANAGVDAIMTDSPELARRVLG